MFVVLSRLSFYHSLSRFLSNNLFFHFTQYKCYLATTYNYSWHSLKRKSVEYAFLYTFNSETHCAKCIDTSIIIICLFHIFLKTFITKKVLFVIKVKKMLQSKLLHIIFLQIKVLLISLRISILIQLILCFS